MDSPAPEAEAWSRCRKIERVVEAVSNSINTFPNGDTLRLDSPCIVEMRNDRSADGELHLKALRHIFPRAATPLLSALAALLLVDLYFFPLDGVTGLDEGTSPPEWSDKEEEEEEGYWDHVALGPPDRLQDDIIPNKAGATSGAHLPNNATTRMQLRQRTLRRRAEMVGICVRMQGQKLLKALCGGGRRDEAPWRMLRVLVDSLERSSH